MSSTNSPSPGAASRISVSAKIFWIVAIFSLPIGVLAYLLASNYTPQIETARLELAGNAFQKPVMQALAGLIDAKALVEGCTGECSVGLKAANDALDPVFRAIDAEGAARGTDLKLDPDSLAKSTHQDLAIQSLDAEWKELSGESKSVATAEDRAKLADRYEHLTGEMKQLISYVGDSSTLILDPDLDSYYVVDVTLLAMPQTFVRIGHTVSLASRITGGKMSAVDEAALQNETQSLAEDLERITASNQTSFDADAGSHGVSATLLPKLSPALQNYEKAAQKYTGVLKSVATNPANITAATFTRAARDANRASLEYWNTAAGELDVLLQKRIDDFKTGRIQALGFSALAVLIAALVAFLVGRSITRPLESLVRDLAPGATLLGASVERIAETSQSRTPNPDEAAIICEELNAHAEKMRKAVFELARHVDGSSPDRQAAELARTTKV